MQKLLKVFRFFWELGLNSVSSWVAAHSKMLHSHNAVAADSATEHASGVETHCIITFCIQHDQAAITPNGSDFRQRIIRRLDNWNVLQPYLCRCVECSYRCE